MSSNLIRKLERFSSLSRADKDALAAMTARPLRNVDKGDVILQEGERPHDICLFLSGWGLRCKCLPGGRRQILSFILPGDLCDLNNFVIQAADHSIVAATPATLGIIAHQHMLGLMQTHPTLFEALCWDQQVSVALLREWITNIGQRTALERMANLLCELFIRLEMAGLTREMRFDLPVTQADLAAAAGLSTVHVNRTLQDLRRMQVVSLSARHLEILDLPRLKAIAHFNSAYLHLPPCVTETGALREPHASLPGAQLMHTNLADASSV